MAKAKQHERITQSELSRALELSFETEKLFVSIGRRLNRGAEIEPGPLSAVTEGKLRQPCRHTLVGDCGVEIGHRKKYPYIFGCQPAA